MDNRFKILFVCTGNSCRSPMAEGILRAKLQAEFADKVAVASAGTLGLNGNPATEFAIMAAADHGADIAKHRSQGVTEELIKESDIVFAMSKEHKSFLDRSASAYRENIYLLKRFARDAEEIDDENIADPIGFSLEIYLQCAGIIAEELDRIMPRLKKLIEEKTRK